MYDRSALSTGDLVDRQPSPHPINLVGFGGGCPSMGSQIDRARSFGRARHGTCVSVGWSGTGVAPWGVQAQLANVCRYRYLPAGPTPLKPR